MAEIRPHKVAHAVRNLLASRSGVDTSQEIATRAAQLGEQLIAQLSRLLGATGSRTVLNRSLHLASASFPWLAGATIERKTDRPVAVLRARLESEPPAVSTEGFVCVLCTAVELLERLIGEALVVRVLGELWPAMFPPGPKETM